MVNREIARMLFWTLLVAAVFSFFFRSAPHQFIAFSFFGLYCIIIAPFYYYTKPRRALDIFELPRAKKTDFIGFDFGDENFNRVVEYVYCMTPDEFMRFCRAMAEMRYDAEQSGLSAAADYLRRHRKPK